MLFDTVRGATKEIYAPYDTGEDTVAESLKSFDADGYTLGNNWPNATGTGSDSWVAWNWIKSATTGFDIVLYTGNGSARTISHSLGAVPEMYIVKRRDAADNWMVYHKDMGNTHYMELNSLNDKADFAAAWNDTSPTSSVFTVGTDGSVNLNTATYMAYLWASVEGFSKVGAYVGNGNTDGTFVYTGFRPAWVMTKAHDRDAHWYMWDNARSPYNQVQKVVWANLNHAEEDSAAYGIDFLSNGFKVRNNQSDTNTSGSVSIYLAFAESSFKYAKAR